MEESNYYGGHKSIISHIDDILCGIIPEDHVEVDSNLRQIEREFDEKDELKETINYGERYITMSYLERLSLRLAEEYNAEARRAEELNKERRQAFEFGRIDANSELDRKISEIYKNLQIINSRALKTLKLIKKILPREWDIDREVYEPVINRIDSYIDQKENDAKRIYWLLNFHQQE